jgi:hypothetical protein
VNQQQSSRWPLWIRIVVAVGTLALLISVYGGYRYGWEWTGIRVPAENANFPKRTLWNWMNLLIIPLVVAIGGYWFNHQAEARNKRLETEADLKKQLRNLEIQRERDVRRAQASSLQMYLERMVPVFGDSDKLNLVRPYTMAVLESLSATQKRVVLQFLYEAELIKMAKDVDARAIEDYLNENHKYEGILDGANLQDAELQDLDLTNADLRGVSLCRANLYNVQLKGADLRGADLSDATGITPEQLHGQTILLSNTTMPNHKKLIDYVWHSDRSKVYHNNHNCNTGKRIAAENYREGKTENQQLCTDCQPERNRADG